MAEDWALQLWAQAPAAVAEVLSKAIAYEEAWVRYSFSPLDATSIAGMRDTHRALLTAVRALKERHG